MDRDRNQAAPTPAGGALLLAAIRLVITALSCIAQQMPSVPANVCARIELGADVVGCGQIWYN